MIISIGRAGQFCARAGSGHATAAPPRSVMNSRRSLDHLVGALLKTQRHVECERLGGLEIVIVCSYLTGTWTGSSLGFAPFRISSTYVAVRRKLSLWSFP
jgi:hypothetical protein